MTLFGSDHQPVLEFSLGAINLAMLGFRGSWWGVICTLFHSWGPGTKLLG